MQNTNYGDDLAKRQKEHLDEVQRIAPIKDAKPCLHDQCTNCIGTGIDKNGNKCIHYISCGCNKCSPRY